MIRVYFSTTFLIALLGIAEISAQTTVNVDSLGAFGDGVTWDHVSIQAAINLAGLGGTIELTHGKTYILCRVVSLLNGQTLIGNGATLKRCNSLLSVLVSGVSVGSTVIEVDHPERFEVGQALALFTGPTHDEGEANNNPRITDITGALLTLDKGLKNAYPAGSGVIMVDLMIQASNDNITIDGVHLDGNRRNNNEWIAWERGSTVHSNGTIARIKNNLFEDCWSNCIFLFQTGVVTDNVFDSVAAAVIHFSGTDSVLFERNQMVDTNTNPGAEHSEAALTWSALNQNITVRDNCLNDSQALAFGVIKRKWNKNITIEDNHVCRSEGFFLLSHQSTPLPGFEEYGHIIIRNNVAVDVKKTSTNNGFDDPPLGNLTFDNNTIVNGYAIFAGLDSSRITDNTIIMLDHATFGDTTGLYADRLGLVTLNRPKRTVMTGNTLIGGEKGIYIRNVYGTAADSLVIQNNTILDSERAGIITADIDYLSGETDWKNDNSGILVDANTVITKQLQLPEDAGIRSSRGATVTNNCIDTNQIGAEVSGTKSTLATGASTTIYAENTLAGEQGSIRYESLNYISDILFDTNTVSSAIPPEFGLATGTVLQGNVIDTTASCSAPSPPPTPACTVCQTGMPELNGVFLDARVLLEGAYVGAGQMASSPAFISSLQDSAWAHPYGSAMFNGTVVEHHGTEFKRPSLPPGMIDWVVVALRSGTDSSSEVSRIAAFLMDDGTIRSLDGTLEVFFPGVAKSSYFVVVYHRNHLSVMSSGAVNFTSGHGSWDFRSAADQAYSSGGGQGMKDLGGVFGMFGGDANTDGMITAIDFNMFLVATKAVLTGYRIEDFSFDDQVTATDFNIFLANTKAVAASQVP